MGEYNRREAISMLGRASLLYLAERYLPQQSIAQTASANPKPDKLDIIVPLDLLDEAPNIETIVNGLSGGPQAITPAFVQEALKLLGANYSRVNGVTYKKAFSAKRHNSSPIELMTGQMSTFVDYSRSSRPDQNNLIVLNENVYPAELIVNLNVGLVHLLHDAENTGENNILSMAHTYRDVLSLTASYPILLRNNDKQCILSIVLKNILPGSQLGGLQINEGAFAFMGMLTPEGFNFGGNSYKKLGFDEIVDVLIKYADDPKKTATPYVSPEEFTRRVPTILQNFVDQSIAYISNKAKLSPEQKRLAAAKFASIEKFLSPPNSIPASSPRI